MGSWGVVELGSGKNVELGNCGIVELEKRFIKRCFHPHMVLQKQHEGLSWKPGE